MHWKGRDEQLKTLLHVYVDCCIEISWSPQTRSHYHRHTRSKEKGIQVHHESHQIIREQKRKGRKKDIPAHLQKKRQRIHSVGLHSFACKDIWHIWFGMRFGNRKGQHVGQVAERGAPGLPSPRAGRLDTDSTSSHLSGLPSRGAALCTGGGREGPMHHPRPLISSFWFLKCFLEGPSNWFLFMF